ncbi:hypothetical protein OpiT1DRAFT_02780 [Opitutaceae bacterium TAV1]|nr:hypothetical protein OpiT1DRAFT_02780 [Opitutaceae bacterium TAV1]
MAKMAMPRKPTGWKPVPPLAFIIAKRKSFRAQSAPVLAGMKTALTIVVTFIATSLFWLAGIALCTFLFLVPLLREAGVMPSLLFSSSDDPPSIVASDSGPSADLPPFQVQVDYPARVAHGETFRLAIRTANPHTSRTTLESIDIYDSLLSGFEIVEVSPAAEAPQKTLDFHSFYFNRPLPPSDSLDVVFTLKAKRKGFHGGDIDVCTPAQDFATISTGIVVE